VIGSTADGDAAPYIEGMQLAAWVVNEGGGVAGKALAIRVEDDGGDPARATDLMDGLLGGGSKAVLYVGPGTAVSPLRSRLEQTNAPLILLEGDLYSTHQLLPQVFQTTIPWAWQAHVIARYLVVDRKAATVGFVGSGLDAKAAATETGAAMAYWGGRLAWSATYSAGGQPPAPVLRRAAKTDAVIDFGAPADARSLGEALAATSPKAPRVAGSAALLQSPSGAQMLAPGTVACYPYTWAGWAHPIKRVASFTGGFQMMFGHPPTALEQEGYDVVRALASALTVTKGRGGEPLVRALETIHATYSSFPVDLGPDDHLFLPRDELGMFAVAGPRERLGPWQMAGSEPWRPIMRTFTSDGKRDDILDRDRPVFFPFWRRDQPGPNYWRSRYGIITRPRDPLH
jgi:ABC-type branched-subunit amino acid transport system substrate-binding protein